MKVKNLLLGSAAALVATTGAQAADLPARKAAPVVAAEFVRICTASGTGFFVIPGTDTCLRVSGRVRAEYRFLEPIGASPGLGRGVDATGMRARGRLNIDAITPTAYGPLRTYIRYELTGDTGNYGQNLASIENTKANVDKAFIQFAGLTAGRVASFFDFYANDLNIAANQAGSDLQTQNVLAYTATLGGGVSATIAIEDNTRRRITSDFAPFQVGSTFATGVLTPGQIALSPFVDDVIYGGTRIPDVVGQFRVDQPFGSLQVSAAAHQMFLTNRTGIGRNGAPFTPLGIAGDPGAGGDFAESDYGYAVQAGVKVNLPMIAQGDVLWLQGAYGEGALSYVLGGSTQRGGGSATGGGAGTFVGQNTPISIASLGLGNNFSDGIVVNGNVKKTEAFSVVAAFIHYFRPDVRGAVFGSYAETDVSRFAGASTLNIVPVSAANPFGLTGANFGQRDTRFFGVGGNQNWSPIRGLEVGAEVDYFRTEVAGNRPVAFQGGAVAGATPVPVRGFRGDADLIEARVRIQRDF